MSLFDASFAITPHFAAVSIEAESFIKKLDSWSWLTNSVFVAFVIAVGLCFLCYKATSKMSLVPKGLQNFFEFVIEFLYGQVESIVGKQVAPRAFPLLATIFIFVLASNWSGLLPGVGTIGFGEKVAPLSLKIADGHGDEQHAEAAGGDAHGEEAGEHHGGHFTPLLRPGTADLNLTLAMALTFMVVWLFITMKEAGPVEFLKHTFLPKGLKGFMFWALLPIFVGVGVIELISIAFRPVSLSLRLFGNVYAGETLLHTMGDLGKSLSPFWSFLTSVIFPLPFYFLEILVGLLQAMVFSLLCAVYIQLSTAHDDHGDEAH